MPFYKKIEINKNTSIFIWKIEETYNELFRSVILKDISLARLEKMKSESHQKGFLAVRKLLHYLNYTDYDLSYDATGKPSLKGSFHISISHSHEFSVIAISATETIGIDLEILKDKIIRIAPKFMNLFHLENLNEEEQIKKATVIWGIKEAIFKIKNEKGISFPDHIFEDNFKLSDYSGMAQLRFNGKIEDFNFGFTFLENYALVYTLEKESN